MTEKIEYRVRPVTRYIVTRYEAAPAIEGTNNRARGKQSSHGEYESESTAYDVATALAFKEREDLGWPPGDERMIFAQKGA